MKKVLSFILIFACVASVLPQKASFSLPMMQEVLQQPNPDDSDSSSNDDEEVPNLTQEEVHEMGDQIRDALLDAYMQENRRLRARFREAPIYARVLSLMLAGGVLIIRQELANLSRQEGGDAADVTDIARRAGKDPCIICALAGMLITWMLLGNFL